MKLDESNREVIKVTDAPYFTKLRDDYGGWIPPFHWHPHYEILVILEGDYSVTNNGTTVSGNTPAIFIHRPYSLHLSYVVPQTHYLRYVVSFDPNITKQFNNELVDLSRFMEASMTVVHPTSKDFKAICNICSAIGYDYSDDITMRTLGTAELIRIINRTCDTIGCQSCGENYSYIQDVLEYVSEHLSERTTLQKLSEHFNVSVTKLQYDFRQSVGTTYKKHITGLRQTHALQLLYSGVSIIKISLECGYSSEAHFIKAFREYWGVTPGEMLRTGFNKLSSTQE